MAHIAVPYRPRQPLHRSPVSRSARVASDKCKPRSSDRDAQLPFDRFERADIGDKALTAGIDEDVAREIVPSAVEDQHAGIGAEFAAIILALDPLLAQHDPRLEAEPLIEPAHEAAVAEHVFEAEIESRLQEIVDRLGIA